jgi:hypothetical protein
MAFATDGDDRARHADPIQHPQHPDLARVAGEMRAEWRAEQDAAAADAAEHWRHRRTLTDWLCERMHAGDVVGAIVAEQRFVGRVEEVGDDLLALRGSFGRVEIHLDTAIPIAFELVEHATRGGMRSPLRRTFRDALVARDAQPDVIVGTTLHASGIRGRLLVGRDFVTVAEASGVDIAVPIAQVAWVAPDGPDATRGSL